MVTFRQFTDRGCLTSPRVDAREAPKAIDHRAGHRRSPVENGGDDPHAMRVVGGFWSEHLRGERDIVVKIAPSARQVSTACAALHHAGLATAAGCA